MSRAYNNSLAMASIGCDEVRQTGYNPTFTIQGKLHHTIGSLLPVDGNAPKFAQIFLIDSDNVNQPRHVYKIWTKACSQVFTPFYVT